MTVSRPVPYVLRFSVGLEVGFPNVTRNLSFWQGIRKRTAQQAQAVIAFACATQALGLCLGATMAQQAWSNPFLGLIWTREGYLPYLTAKGAGVQTSQQSKPPMQEYLSFWFPQVASAKFPTKQGLVHRWFQIAMCMAPHHWHSADFCRLFAPASSRTSQWLPALPTRQADLFSWEKHEQPPLEPFPQNL